MVKMCCDYCQYLATQVYNRNYNKYFFIKSLNLGYAQINQSTKTISQATNRMNRIISTGAGF